MADKTIKSRVQVKRGTSTDWAAAEATFKPLEGEIIFYSDLNKIKIGKKDANGNLILLKDLSFVHVDKNDIDNFAHNHDDRYYTETEVDTKLADKVSKSTTSVQCIKGGLVVGKDSSTGIAGTGQGRIMFTGQTNPLIGVQAIGDDGTAKTPYYVQAVAGDDKLYIGPTSTKALTFNTDGNMESPANLTIKGEITEGTQTLANKYATKGQVKISGTVTKAIGGIAKDKTYTNAELSDVLSDLLFPYVAPTMSSITLSAAAGTFEYGTTKTVSKVTPTFTKGSKNITSVKIGTTSGGADLYSGTSATSDTAITLTTNKTYDGTNGGTIYCTISDGTQSASASASISYAYYNYVIVSNSTTVPTSKGSGKNLAQSCEVSNLATTDNSYIWFLMPNQNKKQIQEYAMNQWNNVNTTAAGSVTFTTDTGKKFTYYAYRTDKMMSNTSKYRIN